MRDPPGGGFSPAAGHFKEWNMGNYLYILALKKRAENLTPPQREIAAAQITRLADEMMADAHNLNNRNDGKSPNRFKLEAHDITLVAELFSAIAKLV